MSLTRIGKELWDFVDAEAGETRRPPDGRPAAAFPARWRVFGPVGADKTRVGEIKVGRHTNYIAVDPLVEAAVEDLSSIPDTLTVGDEELRGRDVAMSGDLLDLGGLYGGHEQGQQAYAMAEMEVEREAEVIFAAGADWWMRWWIDGEQAYDTLGNGNQVDSLCRTDHCFRRRMQPGKHLLVVLVISGQGSWRLWAGLATPWEAILSSLPSSNRWEFLPDLGEIRPPAAKYWTHRMAIRADLCLADETIECEYQQPIHAGHVGIVFGAQDSGHYYWAYIPLWGQLWRARAFYAAIAKTDGSGYTRNLKMQLMPNVPLHRNIWRSLKVERRGNRIQMWVAGVKGPCVTDDTYGPGRVGIAGFSKYNIRNLKIDGRPVKGKPWPEGDRRGRAWFEPVPDLTRGDFQGPWGLVKLSDDEVIMPVVIGRGGGSCHQLNEGNSAVYFHRSGDGGRSWSEYGGPKPAKELPHGAWVVLRPGVIRSVMFDPDGRRFICRDSSDRALTWTADRPGRLLGDWSRDIFREKTWNGMFGFGCLNDGALLSVILHGYIGLNDPVPHHGQGTWGSELAQPYCTLSHDQGMTWSEPVPMDNAALDDGATPDGPCGGFSETAVAQMPGGRIVALARPFRSPFMWQTHSEDGGKSWRMACYAPFSGAGGPQLVATRSGYLAIVKRGPGVGLHFSADGGLNWDKGTMIDFPESFNGRAIEIEPDVLLVVYPLAMDEIRPSPMRVQRIRLTAGGPVPLGKD